LQRETLELLDSSATESIPRRVQEASTWVCGRSVQVHGPQACTGITAGLDHNGFLLVRTSVGLVTVQTGASRRYRSGAQIVLRFPIHAPVKGRKDGHQA